MLKLYYFISIDANSLRTDRRPRPTWKNGSSVLSIHPRRWTHQLLFPIKSQRHPQTAFYHGSVPHLPIRRPQSLQRSQHGRPAQEYAHIKDTLWNNVGAHVIGFSSIQIEQRSNKGDQKEDLFDIGGHRADKMISI